MNRLKRKLAVNGMATILSVIIILAMVAVPALAKKVGSITGSDIEDGTITNVDIAADAAIDASKINRVGLDAETLAGRYTVDFADALHTHEAVGSADIADDAVNGNKVADDSLTGADIADDSLTGDDIADGSVSDSKISYSTKTGYLSIPAVAFKPRYSTTAYNFDVNMNIRKGAGGGYGFFSAPVYLPHGARVTKFELEAKDSDATYDIKGMLWRREGPTGGYGRMATVSTSNSAGWQVLSTSTITPREINNAVNRYTANVTLNGDAADPLKVHRVLITYTYTVPGG